jgi:hypothetical protein
VHTLSIAHVIYVTTGAAIRNGAVVALRGLDLKHSGATCMMCASLGVSMCPTTSSSMTARPIPVSGYRTTALRAGLPAQHPSQEVGDREVPSVLWSFRTMPNRLINFTPFFMVYVAHVVLPTNLQYGPPGSGLINQMRPKKLERMP